MQEERQPTRSFWFQSGDVVLHAENTQFRVHCKMLSHHSNVFKAMFGMPQFGFESYADDEVFVDGCPVVPLSDKAADVEHMLSVFYDNSKTHWESQMDIDHFSAVLRLGKKYEIELFTKEALRRVRSDYPATLDAWDQRGVYREEVKIVWEEAFVDALIKFINLAHELSVPSILPAAYFLYVHLTPLRSVVEEKRLCSQDRLHCILGRAEVLDFIRHRLKEWHEHEVLTAGEDCSSPAACGALRLETVENEYFYLWKGFDIDYTPLESLGDPLSEFCLGCRNSIQNRYDENRAQLWKKLPTFFGLPEWQELQQLDFDR
ncbi:hypothetical protein GALMADRAFT_228921 [Galerina marginata CBS 339.88]|uniref:BTB domain-containing protein n=1 Tax=Galerina marginata (strain CBS 339.88) TaxID=685588 RepID=A0A067T0U9_GALM3|nr:hypothetical protein GALMADRAFT_228921 [Galerina marginata CBS 339.88]